MKLKVRRFEPRDLAAIERLNERLEQAGDPHPVYPEPTPTGPDGAAASPIRERLFVAAESSEVRGAIWLKEAPFWLGDREVVWGWAKYPVGESSVDPRYRGVPAGLIRHLLREQRYLMALGLGGHDTPFARLLAGMGWKGSTIPLHLRIVHPNRVLREIPYLRRTRARRILMDGLALSGLGWLAYRLGDGLRQLTSERYPSAYRGEIVRGFGGWSDALWRASRHRYAFTAVRDSRTLDARYPPSFAGLTRIRVRRHGEPVGWICVVEADMRDGEGGSNFGRLSVGLLADGFAPPEHARGVLATGCQHLLDRGVDLILSNQSHPKWRNALRSLRFFEGPSNFAFYRSPEAQRSLDHVGGIDRGFHVNRGDCDGPRLR